MSDLEPTEPAKLTYESYLKVPELLRLQVPRSDPPHHDELLFIIIHQAYELWFHLILHELEWSIRFMDRGQVLRAHHFLERVVAIQKLLVQQIHILETMTPIEFLAFRERLKPASGFQSVQFREIEFIAGLKDPRMLAQFPDRDPASRRLHRRFQGPDLRTSFYGLLAQLGFAMPPEAAHATADQDPEARRLILAALDRLYSRPDSNLELYLLAEALVDFDEHLSLWRDHHVKVVERVIGRKRGTGGSEGVAYLETTLSKRCFPLLWEVRSHLEDAAAPPARGSW
jgi:tryptophan 2,3-dioxygenase